MLLQPTSDPLQVQGLWFCKAPYPPTTVPLVRQINHSHSAHLLSAASVDGSCSCTSLLGLPCISFYSIFWRSFFIPRTVLCLQNTYGKTLSIYKCIVKVQYNIRQYFTVAKLTCTDVEFQICNTKIDTQCPVFRIKPEKSIFLKHFKDMELDCLFLTQRPSYPQWVYKTYANFKRKTSKRFVLLVKLKIPAK